METGIRLSNQNSRLNLLLDYCLSIIPVISCWNMNEREVITENLKKLPIGKSVNLLHFVSMFIITELYTQSL